MTEVCSKTKISLGNWLRLKNNHGSEVSKWMKATGMYDDHTRPVHITTKEYMKQEKLNDRRMSKKRKGEKAQIEIESPQKNSRVDR